MTTEQLLHHRVESWRYELLDQADVVISVLDGVIGGQIDLSTAADIRGSGNITLRPQETIDWTQRRLRVSYQVGDAAPVPLITAIAKAPVEQHSDPGITVNLEIFDKTVILHEDAAAGSWTVDAGDLALDAVADVIASTGEGSPLIGDSSKTIAAPMVWEAGTPKLRIANDLLAAAAFFSLHTDGSGLFRADPYVDPLARGIAWKFIDDDTGLYLPAFTRDRNVYSVPNRYVVVGRGDAATAAPVAIATDEDPASPYSYGYRGRWITRTETGVDATDTNVLAQIARRKLTAAQTVAETFEITHPWLPFGLNDVVSFTNERLGAPVLAVVQKQTIRLTPGGLVTSILRRVG